MNAHATKFLHFPMAIGGIAAILVSGIAIGSLAISRADFNASDAVAERSVAAAAPAGAVSAAHASRCAECGVIESTRKVDDPDEWAGVSQQYREAAGKPGAAWTNPGRNYEITIRLQDGSKRIVTDAHPARWRPGERVTLIGAAEQAQR